MFKTMQVIYKEAAQEPAIDQNNVFRNKTKIELIIETIHQLWLMLICRVFGHVIVDNDPGDLETGPQPDIHCARCGKQF